MKTLKLNALIVSGLITFGAVTGITASTYAQTVTASAETPVKFQKEKSAISIDLSNIQYQRQHIKNLEEKYKRDKKAKDEVAIAADKTEIRKAKADLDRSKCYLWADKRNLINSYNVAMEMRDRKIAKDEDAIAYWQKKLDKDLEEGNEAAASKDATVIAQNVKELKNDQKTYRNLSVEQNNQVIAVNREIRNAYNGKFVPSLYAQNTVANAKNMMSK